ncbi:hypothetical protein CRUP_028447 [Coryphaenoides rupestris]|nr:hypothetical protein CRUP_028447 [Coryphaenoides rupestris]
MQWTPEHSQWAEQYFDISSTTCSPAHKVETYRGHLQRSYQYAWANDDISALTASNLLKKYAEKYSGLLESPNERALLCSYADGGMNARKSESESWQEGIYPMNCAPDVISVSKAGMTAALPSTDVCASIGSSPGVASTLSEPSYSSSNCGSHAAAAGLPSQEYPAGYSGSYLHSSYSGQTTPALPSPQHPSPLHSAGILQPPLPVPPPGPSTLVPGYKAGSPNLSGYNYPPAGYPPQMAVAPGYSPGEAPPPSTYMPSGIAAPTPLPPSTLPGYTYQSHNHTPITPTPLNGSTTNSLKRKTFYMTGHGDMDSSYGNFTYSQQRCRCRSPMYRIPDISLSDSTRANGFERNAETSSLVFKPSKQQRKFSVHSSRMLSPSSYGSTKGSVGNLRPGGESYGGKFDSANISEQSEEHRPSHLSHSSFARADMATSSSHAAEEQLKNSDSGLVDMVTMEVLQQGPPVDWSDIAGLDMAKAAIKEEILWPILRPDMFSGLSALPRSLLLFGPQGTGRTLLARCMAHQLGAVFLRLNSAALVTKWLGKADKIIQASFLVARSRQPAVIFISEVDLLLAASLGANDRPRNCLKTELLLQLDSVLSSLVDHVLVVCSTNKPEDIPESLRRYFVKRLLVPLPDVRARHQIISQLLAQHNYGVGEKETSLLVQRTEGFSGLEVAQLCQEAVLGSLQGLAGAELSTLHAGQMRHVSDQDFDNVFCKFQPSISQKELDMYTEWNKMFGCSQ